VFGWMKKIGRRHIKMQRKQPFNMAMFDGASPELFKALAEHWAQDDNYKPQSLDAELRIEEIEQRYSVKLPDDFKVYLLLASPNEIYMDDIGTQWWSIADIKNVTEECEDILLDSSNAEIEAERDQYIIFADFLIWCYAWAICCSAGKNRGKVALIGGSPDHFVADSLRDFLALEIVDSREIH
jgi:hypothetical protein